MKRALVIFAIACLAHSAYAQDAMKVLVKALGSQRDVRATLVQRRSDGTQRITVNVQIVPRRGVMANVTHPLLFAGMVSYDNGSQWKNYDPQTNVLRIEPSPSKFHLDTTFRRRLIEKNYALSMEREALVAGRASQVVFLKARHSDVASRRLYIDSQNSLILRYIVQEPDGTQLTTVDTLSVDLDSPIDVSKFEKIGEGAAKVEKSWGPIEVSRATDAKRYVGFTPLIPATLPVGLAKQAIHVVGTEKRPFVGVRLTDGMAVVTVYLWQPKDGADEPFKGAFDAKAGDGTRVKVVGDATARIRGDLARIFAREYGGPSVQQGTQTVPIDVQKSKTSTGGGGVLKRPRLVIDNEQ